MIFDEPQDAAVLVMDVRDCPCFAYGETISIGIRIPRPS